MEITIIWIHAADYPSPIWCTWVLAFPIVESLLRITELTTDCSQCSDCSQAQTRIQHWWFSVSLINRWVYNPMCPVTSNNPAPPIYIHTTAYNSWHQYRHDLHANQHASYAQYTHTHIESFRPNMSIHLHTTLQTQYIYTHKEKNDLLMDE